MLQVKRNLKYNGGMIPVKATAFQKLWIQSLKFIFLCDEDQQSAFVCKVHANS